MDVKSIYDKHGELIFRLAVTHLFDKGMENAKTEDVEETIQRLKENPEAGNDLLGKDTRIKILECVKDLINVPLWDVLRFIKTNVAIDGTEVTDGKIVQLRHNVTGDVITTLLCDPTVDQFDVDDVSDKIDDELAEHLAAHDDAADFDYIESAIKAFRKAGHKARVLPPHDIIYV